MGPCLRLLLALTIAWLAAASPARAEWRRAESPNFIVYSQADEDRLRQQVAQLEDYDRLLRTLTGATAPPSPNKLEVYIVRRNSQLDVVRPVSEAVGGFYTARPTGIAALVDETGSARDNETLFHEYAHHFMTQYFPGAYPPWYVEGFAEYMMTAQFRPDRIEYGNYSRDRAFFLGSNTLMSMSQLIGPRPERATALHMARYYAQSWLAVHYFFSNAERRAKLVRYLAAVARGDDSAASFERETGMTIAQMDSELSNYIRGRRITFHRAARAASAPPTVTITRLPASADDLLLLDAAARLDLEESRRATILRRIRDAALVAWSDDVYAKRVRARAEALFGDGAAADVLLQELLADAPGDSELLYLNGMRHLVAARAGIDSAANFRAAQQWFARAHRADPNHFPTLYHYAESLRNEPHYVSDNTLNILLLARELAPQVSEITLTAAHLMMSRGAFEDAEALLAPLASDVHRGSMALTARALLEAAKNRQPPGPLVFLAEEAAK